MNSIENTSLFISNHIILRFALQVNPLYNFFTMLKNSKISLTRDFFNTKYIDKTVFYGIIVVAGNAP
nr:MAG TPA: hypothetical protein [Caudoviricetes sp.]